MPRRKKTTYEKLRAKAVKSVTRKRKAAKKAVTKSVKRVKRSAKRLKKTTLKTTKKRIKSTRKSINRTVKRAKRSKTAKDFRKWKRGQTRSTIIRGDVDVSGARVTQAGTDPGASKPGEPPKMRTGRGRNSIRAAEVRGTGSYGRKLKPAARTFVDKKIAGYMAMWEFRKDGKARPFLAPSYRANKKILQGVLMGNLKKLKRQGRRRKAVVK